MQKITTTLQLCQLKMRANLYGLLFKATKNRYFFDKRIKIGIVIVSILNLSAYGQETAATKHKKKSKEASAIQKKDTTYRNADITCYVVETMPSFNGGGIDSLLQFIKRNIRYPKSGLESKKEGIVYIQFTVDTLGNVVNPRVIRGIDPDFDAEALRVIKLSPPWTPGKMWDKAAAFPYTIPVRFRLENQ